MRRQRQPVRRQLDGVLAGEARAVPVKLEVAVPVRGCRSHREVIEDRKRLEATGSPGHYAQLRARLSARTARTVRRFARQPAATSATSRERQEEQRKQSLSREDKISEGKKLLEQRMTAMHARQAVMADDGAWPKRNASPAFFLEGIRCQAKHKA